MHGTVFQIWEEENACIGLGIDINTYQESEIQSKKKFGSMTLHLKPNIFQRSLQYLYTSHDI